MLAWIEMVIYIYIYFSITINIFYDTVWVNILAPLGITVKTNK